MIAASEKILRVTAAAALEDGAGGTGSGVGGAGGADGEGKGGEVKVLGVDAKVATPSPIPHGVMCHGVPLICTTGVDMYRKSKIVAFTLVLVPPLTR